MKKNITVSRDRLVSYLDHYLEIADIPDWSPNGLQVQGSATVSGIAFAVDASVETIRSAARIEADMLIVHHGLFWGEHKQIVGNLYKRIAGLIGAGLSLYASHLPLDCHPIVGNNAEIVRLLRMENVGRFAVHKGTAIGVLAQPENPLQRDALVDNIEKSLRCKAVLLPFGPSRVRRVGVVAGGAAKFAEEAKRSGCDALVTGESSHAAFHEAKEARINVVYGGHYATETVGLKALMRHMKEKFSVPGKFIPAPTGY